MSEPARIIPAPSAPSALAERLAQAKAAYDAAFEAYRQAMAKPRADCEAARKAYDAALEALRQATAKPRADCEAARKAYERARAEAEEAAQ
jgi:hypothetical protein